MPLEDVKLQEWLPEGVTRIKGRHVLKAQNYWNVYLAGLHRGRRIHVSAAGTGHNAARSNAIEKFKQEKLRIENKYAEGTGPTHPDGTD